MIVAFGTRRRRLGRRAPRRVTINPFLDRGSFAAFSVSRALPDRFSEVREWLGELSFGTLDGDNPVLGREATADEGLDILRCGRVDVSFEPGGVVDGETMDELIEQHRLEPRARAVVDGALTEVQARAWVRTAGVLIKTPGPLVQR